MLLLAHFKERTVQTRGTEIGGARIESVESVVLIQGGGRRGNYTRERISLPRGEILLHPKVALYQQGITLDDLKGFLLKKESGVISENLIW